MSTSPFLRNTLPVITTFIAAVIVLIPYYFKVPALVEMSKELVRWNVILAAFALALGIGGMVRMHAGKVQRRSPDTPYSIGMLATLVVFVWFGFTQGTRGAQYKWLYDNLLMPFQATSFATTFFFITSAAFRAFRIKNAQSIVLLASALLVMGRVGIEAAAFPELEKISAWIMDIPNTAGMRAVTIGGSIALVSNAFRIITGLERSHFGRD